MGFRFLSSAERRSTWPICSAIALALIAVVVSFTSFVSAQNSNGALRGEIQDVSGARVVGAQVVVEAQRIVRHASCDRQ